MLPATRETMSSMAAFGTLKVITSALGDDWAVRENGRGVAPLWGALRRSSTSCPMLATSPWATAPSWSTAARPASSSKKPPEPIFASCVPSRPGRLPSFFASSPFGKTVATLVPSAAASPPMATHVRLPSGTKKMCSVIGIGGTVAAFAAAAPPGPDGGGGGGGGNRPVRGPGATGGGGGGGGGGNELLQSSRTGKRSSSRCIASFGRSTPLGMGVVRTTGKRTSLSFPLSALASDGRLQAAA